MKNRVILLGFVLATVFPGAGGAAVVNFDDLSSIGQAVPNGYGGLDWNNFFVLEASPDDGGYAAGTISPANVAYNAYGSPASITSTASFALESAYMTAAWNDGLSVEVFASNKGAPVYSKFFQLSSTSPTLIDFGSAVIDKITFTSFGGTPHGYAAGSGTHFALDDLTTDLAPPGGVPEPADWSMMAAGFVVIGSARRYRSRPSRA
jgi:hypothetical protein